MNFSVEFVLGILCWYLLVSEIETTFLLTVDPDLNRNVSQLIESKGYPVENHVALTEDGYLLSIQHIPRGRKPEVTTGGKKEVVFCQHGLLSASHDFVVNFPHQSLGFILADLGYDVWLGNIRGNTYSKRNVYYSTNTNRFWNFSFHEMGVYDLPAMIDYVLNQTGREQLFYVGHSQGTTAALVTLSMFPEYNKKIKLFIALAPAALFGYMTSPIRYLAPFTREIHAIFNILGVQEFMPADDFTKFVSIYVCGSILKFICEGALFLIHGADPAQLNSTRLEVYTAHTPAGTSVKNVAHFGQLVNSKRFRRYDYGREGNMRQYNRPTPPDYEVSQITAPVAFMWSLNDAIADPTDVHILQGMIKSLVSSYLVEFPPFTHVDFILAIEANRLVHRKVVSLLRKYK